MTRWSASFWSRHRRWRNPFFHHTVILILQHNEHGSFGIIVNRPAGERVSHSGEMHAGYKWQFDAIPFDNGENNPSA
jgi:Uncharacterized ACR, COG1678